MLVLLQNVGWFLLTFVLGTIVVLVSYYTFMSFGGYRWSIRSAIQYLADHGRGNFPDENQYIVGIDIVTRLLWVLVYTVVTGVLGCVLLPSWLLRAGFILAELSFAFLMIRIELCFYIQIGRLVRVDTEGKVAYFTNIGDNREFAHIYDEDGEDLLSIQKKYLVADYGIFSMFAAIDEYEWGR